MNPTILKRMALAITSVALAMPYSYTFADEDVMEEIIVTARQQAETLQDVPVTIAALTEEDLERYNITSLVDAAKMIPNMVIAAGGSGNGSALLADLSIPQLSEAIGLRQSQPNFASAAAAATQNGELCDNNSDLLYSCPLVRKNVD